MTTTLPAVRLVRTNGIELAVHEAVPDVPRQVCVVLCHGFPELAASWRGQMQPLADAGFHVIAPDLRGYGGSDRPDDPTSYSIAETNVAGKDADKLYAALSPIAPTVATQGTGLHWKEDFLLVSDALGKRDQAQTLLDAYHRDAAALGESLDGEPTVSFVRKNGDRIRVFGVASFTGSVAEDAGLARPESQDFTDKTSQDISNEQLDAADGDWIFYGVQGGDDSSLTDAPLWRTLKAVDDDQAVSVDDDLFYLNAGPTAARGVLTVLQDKLGQ